MLGVCSMDVKARSKAMREILTRLQEIEGQGLEIRIFGDKVILDEGKSDLVFALGKVGSSSSCPGYAAGVSRPGQGGWGELEGRQAREEG